MKTPDSSEKSFKKHLSNQVLYFKNEFRLNSKTYWKRFCHFDQRNKLLKSGFEFSIIYVVMPSECFRPLLSYTKMCVEMRSIYGKKISLASFTQREKSPKYYSTPNAFFSILISVWLIEDFISYNIII